MSARHWKRRPWPGPKEVNGQLSRSAAGGRAGSAEALNGLQRDFDLTGVPLLTGAQPGHCAASNGPCTIALLFASDGFSGSDCPRQRAYISSS